MKRICFFFILFLSVFSIMASPGRTSPVSPYNTYGGRIYFKNTSSYNQYWEVDIIDDPGGGFYFERFCLEINDVIIRGHTFSVLIADDDKFDRSSADPNNYFKAIRIYDMDTGTLLKEFRAGNKIFVLTAGSIESGAVWDVDITGSLLTGGD